MIPFFTQMIERGEKTLPITDYRMTRFWISLEEGVELVIKALAESKGGEIFISKIPSFKVVDLARAISPDCETKEVGIREGEKLHEVMVTKEDAAFTYEYEKHYIIYPHFNWWGPDWMIAGGKKVQEGFEYSSGNNSEWLDIVQLRERLSQIK